MRRGDFILLLAGLVATWPLVGHAQNSPVGYPDRPITLIVPYAPGGGNDVLARAVAEPMGKSVGQPLVIEPRECRRFGRHPPGRQGRARRLHPWARWHWHARHRPDALSERRLRSA